MDNLKTIINNVVDEEIFLDFIEHLYRDRVKYKNDPYKWQNDTIEDFLECAHAWGVVSKEGLEYYTKSDNPWKRCAEILYMGKIYE